MVTSPGGGALPGFPSQVCGERRERAVWASGWAPRRPGGPRPPAVLHQDWVPSPLPRWVLVPTAGHAHIPLDSADAIFPAPAPHPGTPSAPGPCQSLKQPRRPPPLPVLGSVHPSAPGACLVRVLPTPPGFHGPLALHSAPGSVRLPACLPGSPPPCSHPPSGGPLPRMPPLETGSPRGARNCSLQGPKHPEGSQAPAHALPPPHAPGGPALCTCVCASNRCPGPGGTAGAGWAVAAGDSRGGQREERGVRHGEPKREGGRAGESAGGGGERGGGEAAAGAGGGGRGGAAGGWGGGGTLPPAPAGHSPGDTRGHTRPPPPAHRHSRAHACAHVRTLAHRH